MKTILIIDDDMHIGDMLTEVPKREGDGVLLAGACAVLFAWIRKKGAEIFAML